MPNDRKLLFAAALLRSMAMGMIGPLLGFYLAGLQFDDTTIGATVSAGLGGAALATAWVTFFARGLSRRASVLGVMTLSLLGGVVAALASGPWVVGAAAFVGMLNGMGRDRGACLVVEHAMLSETASDAGRTKAFASYTVMQDIGVAVGALCSGLPSVLERVARIEELPALRASMGAYLGILALSVLPHLLLSRTMAMQPVRALAPISPESRGILTRMCALFAIDSIAGGFITSSFLALYFRRQFDADETAIGALFAARSVLNAVSHFGAARIARRFGLVNTMVFTHIPSSLLLVTVTMSPNFGVAAALFLLREGLVEMDVPTRTSYVMAVVSVRERTFASGVTHLVRMAGWAVGPILAGVLSDTSSSLATPIWIGAGMKILYDVLLYAAFRNHRPPEERGAE